MLDRPLGRRWRGESFLLARVASAAGPKADKILAKVMPIPTAVGEVLEFYRQLMVSRILCLMGLLPEVPAWDA